MSIHTKNRSAVLEADQNLSDDDIVFDNFESTDRGNIDKTVKPPK